MIIFYQNLIETARFFSATDMSHICNFHLEQHEVKVRSVPFFFLHVMNTENIVLNIFTHKQTHPHTKVYISGKKKQ